MKPYIFAVCSFANLQICDIVEIFDIFFDIDIDLYKNDVKCGKFMLHKIWLALQKCLTNQISCNINFPHMTSFLERSISKFSNRRGGRSAGRSGVSESHRVSTFSLFCQMWWLYSWLVFSSTRSTSVPSLPSSPIRLVEHLLFEYTVKPWRPYTLCNMSKEIRLHKGFLPMAIHGRRTISLL